jgi:hypothetical protein
MPLSLFLLLTIAQAFVAYLRFDNLLVPLVGVLTYVMPLFSIVFAYQLACRQGGFRFDQFMKWYVVCIALALTTVCLEFWGYRWPILGQVGNKLLIYDQFGAMISYSGSFRASEIAAWHAMTAACFAVMLFMQRITFRRFLMTVTVATLLIGLGLLTGRRKMIVELAVFAGTYFILWLTLEKRTGKLASIGLFTAALAGYAVLAGLLQEDIMAQPGLSDYSMYIERSRSVFQEVPSRFVDLGLGPIMWAYESFGIFGAGLGVGTQGTQYFGGGGAMAAAAEGGLGKITLELGIPGLFMIGWCAIWFVRYLLQIMRAASRQSVKVGRLSIGAFSFLVANVAGFSVATQAYGDLFVLLILSWMLGFLLAVPAVLEWEVRTRQPKIFEAQELVFQPKTV